MQQKIKEFLDQLPWNGKKTWIGFFVGALVLGLMQLGKIDATTGGYALDIITLWTGVALTHRALKAPGEPEINVLPPQP